MTGQLLQGLIVGGAYALAAVGLTYTIGISRIINFSYGTMYMLGAMIVASFGGLNASLAGNSLAVVVAVLLVGVIGFIIARFVIIRLVADPDAVIIGTLAIDVILVNLGLMYFGTNPVLVDTPLSQTVLRLLGTHVTLQQLLIVVLAPLVTLALVLFMKRTRRGAEIRAVAQEPNLAGVSGVNVRGTYIVAVLVGVVIAAAIGALVAANIVPTVFAGQHFFLKAFAIAALAGLGQLWGALIVGFVIGISEVLLSVNLTGAYTPAVIYVLLIVALVFFPRGLFNTRTSA
ncbi:branched-chain amino acid ABC transporter permease [Microcella sp.]|uniref:branched-chain amino acid ABC transporter permease n=1 Tax=Microcella sp. TaxID=1913979 RepID=UPI00256E53BF|nr:branched-chain amino acid ABC transporter permease [Microcella sp.]MBX9472389.1 branched-chain amino acid ABC transporter permease [Microcella sp.]